MECEAVLEALEEIDDEADMYGIDFVKSDDENTAKAVGGVFSTPALVYFRKGNPLVYDGGYKCKINLLCNTKQRLLYKLNGRIRSGHCKGIQRIYICAR